MKLQATKELKYLANKFNFEEQDLSEYICQIGMTHQWFEDNDLYWLHTLREHLDESGVNTETAFMLVFPSWPNKYDLKNFENLITIGGGDCSECGGELEWIDGEYKTTQVDYDSEPEHEQLWAMYKCKSCGHITSDEPDLD